MGANLRRHKPRDRVVGGNEAIDEVYNVYAGGLKVVGPILGALPNGAPAATTAQNCAPGQIYAFYNPGTTPVYLAFGATNSLATPTGPTNGIPLLPGEYTNLAVPIGCNWFIASGTAYGYQIQDDSTIS